MTLYSDNAKKAYHDAIGCLIGDGERLKEKYEREKLYGVFTMIFLNRLRVP